MNVTFDKLVELGGSAEISGAKAQIIFLATAHDATVIESTGKKGTLNCQLMNKVDMKHKVALPWFRRLADLEVLFRPGLLIPLPSAPPSTPSHTTAEGKTPC